MLSDHHWLNPGSYDGLCILLVLLRIYMSLLKPACIWFAVWSPLKFPCGTWNSWSQCYESNLFICGYRCMDQPFSSMSPILWSCWVRSRRSSWVCSPQWRRRWSQTDLLTLTNVSACCPTGLSLSPSANSSCSFTSCLSLALTPCPLKSKTPLISHLTCHTLIVWIRFSYCAFLLTGTSHTSCTMCHFLLLRGQEY